MKKLVSGFVVFAAFIICISILMPAALAVGVSVSASSSSVKIGDTVSVSVVFSGTNIFGAEATFSYNSSVLQYQGGSGTSDGKIVLYAASETVTSLSCKISFKAIAAGSSTVSVNCTSAYDSSLTSLGGGSGSSSITVKEASSGGGTVTPKPTPKPTSKPTSTPAPTPSPEIKKIAVEVGGVEMYVICQIPDTLEIPAGFTAADTQFRTEDTQALFNGGGIMLLYLEDANGENGALYIYDAAADTLVRFFSLIIPEKQLFPAAAGYEISVPEGYTAQALEYNGASIQAWSADINDGNYIIYACDASGTYAFYSYNPDKQEIASFTFPEPTDIEAEGAAVTDDGNQDAAATGKDEDTENLDIVILALISAVVIFGAGCAVLAILYIRQKRKMIKPSKDTEKIEEIKIEQ